MQLANSPHLHRSLEATFRGIFWPQENSSLEGLPSLIPCGTPRMSMIKHERAAITRTIAREELVKEGGGGSHAYQWFFRLCRKRASRPTSESHRPVAAQAVNNTLLFMNASQTYAERAAASRGVSCLSRHPPHGDGHPPQQPHQTALVPRHDNTWCCTTAAGAVAQNWTSQGFAARCYTRTQTVECQSRVTHCMLPPSTRLHRTLPSSYAEVPGAFQPPPSTATKNTAQTSKSALKERQARTGASILTTRTWPEKSSPRPRRPNTSARRKSRT